MHGRADIAVFLAGEELFVAYGDTYDVSADESGEGGSREEDSEGEEESSEEEARKRKRKAGGKKERAAVEGGGVEEGTDGVEEEKLG